MPVYYKRVIALVAVELRISSIHKDTKIALSIASCCFNCVSRAIYPECRG